MSTSHAYRLVRPDDAAPSAGVRLDAFQQQVVDHPGGPLLVLAGPGTGKTTTLVEAIAERVEGRGAAPESILALTFSRKAADQLRDRVTARLGRTTSGAMCVTFHSFAYGLIRRYAPAELYTAPLRLLSAPEQDVILRELLSDAPESVRWPDTLHRALGTRGFAAEVQAVLSRAREKGLDGPALERLGREEGIDEFIAAGAFLEQYLQTLDDVAATDYADLIRRAVIEAHDHIAEVRARFSHVFVDEYQDTDPGQVALLRALAGDGRNLVVVGDPHQSIYGFRGAEVRGILDFPAQFPRSDGQLADVVALGTTRRFGERLLIASQRVAGRLALPGSIPAAAREAFLAPRAAGDHGEGRAQVITFDTERAEAEHIADLLRRAHLEDGIAWSDMAVLVRSGRATLPGLRRSLGAAGVPVEVAADEVPLVRDPAVLPLLDALRAVVHLDLEEVDHVEYLDPGRVESLLTGPLGGLDAGDVRRLARALRAREKQQRSESGSGGALPRTSRELLRRSLVTEDFLTGLDHGDPAVRRAAALSTLLHRCRRLVDAGEPAEQVLWELWDGTDWPQRLQRAVGLGGGAARRAHRDLDAICALFEAAQRAEEQRDHVGVRNFLASLVAQQIPADSLAERGVRGSAVRLLTAHRSKGLEWSLVVVAHVQADAWPDVRRRSTLLRADRIGVDGVVPPVSARELLIEERRLFYVACTRARQRLVVTAVQSQDDDGEQPSRFLAELGVAVEHVAGRPRRPLSMAGLVSELRRTVADPDTPEALRVAAARRLARLASETAGARPLVPAADPATWWGTRSPSRSVQPLRDPSIPVPISATVLDSVLTCPLHHFLEREAGGASVAHQSAAVGTLVHALADRVARGELGTDPSDLAPLMAAVDAVWDRLEFRTPWSRAREYRRVEAALTKFLAWHHSNARLLLGTEQRFNTVIDLDEGERVRLTGYADRVELAADGRVVVVDLKTGRSKPSDPEVQRHTQLGLYQLIVDSGGIDEIAAPHTGGAAAASGGGELVQLGLEDGANLPVTQAQAVHTDDAEPRAALRVALARTAAILRSENFPATPGDHCRTCEFVALCPAKSAGAVTA